MSPCCWRHHSLKTQDGDGLSSIWPEGLFPVIPFMVLENTMQTSIRGKQLKSYSAATPTKHENDQSDKIYIKVLYVTLICQPLSNWTWSLVLEPNQLPEASKIRDLRKESISTMIPYYPLNLILILKEKCSNHPSAKKPLFTTNGDPHRKPQHDKY